MHRGQGHQRRPARGCVVLLQKEVQRQQCMASSLQAGAQHDVRTCTCAHVYVMQVMLCAFISYPHACGSANK